MLSVFLSMLFFRCQDLDNPNDNHTIFSAKPTTSAAPTVTTPTAAAVTSQQAESDNISNTHRTPTITPPIYSRDTTVEPGRSGHSRMTSDSRGRAHVTAAKPKPKVAESNVPNASHASRSKKAGGGERKPRDERFAAAAPGSVPRHVLAESRRQPRSDARHINVPAADLIQPLAASTRASLAQSRDATKATNSSCSTNANSSFNYDYVAAALGRAMPLEGAMTQAHDDDDVGGGGGGADDELNTSFADKLRLEEERRELTEKRARQAQERERRRRVQKITELPPAVTQPKRVRVSRVTTQE